MSDPDLVIDAHRGMALAVSFTPDGQKILSAGMDATIGIWSPSGAAIGRLEGHAKGVNSIVVTRDSSRTMTGSTDGTVRLWSIAERTELRVIEAHAKTVSRVAISPDESLLATASYDSKVRLWSVATGELVADLRGHPKNVTSVSFSPDGDLVVSGGLGADVIVWDTTMGAEVTRLGGHGMVAVGAAFADDEATLLTLGYDGVLHEWNTKEWTERRTRDVGEASSFSIAPGGQRLALNSDHHIRVIDRSSDTIVDHELPIKGVYGMAWSADGQRLANAGADGRIRVWG